MSRYEPTAPFNEDFMDTLVKIGRQLERIAEELEQMNGQRQNADNDIWQEIHNINGHLDGLVVAVEQLAMEVDN